jgi:hypothetical protein
MTPATDLVQCANCDGLFTSASSDDVFYHATCRCRTVPGPALMPVRVRAALTTDNRQLTASPDN